MRRRRRVWVVSKRGRALSLLMAEQGPWDPADDAYNERVSPVEGGEDPSPNRRPTRTFKFRRQVLLVGLSRKEDKPSSGEQSVCVAT